MLFWRDFGRLRTSITNISGTEQDIDSRKTALQTAISPASVDSLVNFGPQMSKNRTVVLTHPPAIDLSVDLLDVLERHGYSRSATEHWPARDRRGRAQRNMDIMESRHNRPLLSVRYEDDDDHRPYFRGPALTSQ